MDYWGLTEMHICLRDTAGFPKRVNGAGVLLFSVIDGEPHFVLARDAPRRNHDVKRSWSGFEGTSTRNESPVAVASREFAEESLGVVSNISTSTQMYDELDSGSYSARLNLVITKTSSKSQSCYYTTFVKEIDFDSELSEKFRSSRRRLLDIKMHCGKYVNVTKLQRCYAEYASFFDAHPGVDVTLRDRLGRVRDASVHREYLEKDEIQYFPLSQVHALLEGIGGCIKPTYVPSLLMAIEVVLRLTCFSHVALPVAKVCVLDETTSCTEEDREMHSYILKKHGTRAPEGEVI